MPYANSKAHHNMSDYPQQLLAVINAQHYTEKAALLKTIKAPTDGYSWDIPEIPRRPGRPEHYEESEKIGRRRKGLHHEGTRHKFLLAIHHIEYSAIDLAVLLCLRSPGMSQAYHADFLEVAREECEHATLLGDLLEQRGYPPGSKPVHFRLWDSALAARDAGEQMVVIPRFLEARGLDVTAELLPRIAEIDPDAHAVLKRIYDDDIGHVGRGSHWHRIWCAANKIDPTEHYHQVVQMHFADQIPSAQAIDHEGRIKAGFNDEELEILIYRPDRPTT